MAFNILAWNVEKLRGTPQRLRKVARHVRDQDPDVFGLFEVESLDVLKFMRDEFPDYTFGITDGRQRLEILVGWRNSKFEQVIFTQKREFRAYNPNLRPGAMLSARLGSEFLNFLFLHTDSGTGAPDFGNRAEMFEHIEKMKRSLDKKVPGPARANLVVLGDLNTMGMSYPTRRASDRRVNAQEEIIALTKAVKSEGMILVEKDENLTFNNLRLQSDLDHVLASKDLPIIGKVRVRGWNQLSGHARKRFIEDVSDHSSLLLTVGD